jgi:hypothetical protein
MLVGVMMAVAVAPVFLKKWRQKKKMTTMMAKKMARLQGWQQ